MGKFWFAIKYFILWVIWWMSRKIHLICGNIENKRKSILKVSWVRRSDLGWFFFSPATRGNLGRWGVRARTGLFLLQGCLPPSKPRLIVELQWPRRPGLLRWLIRTRDPTFKFVLQIKTLIHVWQKPIVFF